MIIFQLLAHIDAVYQDILIIKEMLMSKRTVWENEITGLCLDLDDEIDWFFITHDEYDNEVETGISKYDLTDLINTLSEEGIHGSYREE
jgi:hypothetical protein